MTVRLGISSKDMYIMKYDSCDGATLEVINGGKQQTTPCGTSIETVIPRMMKGVWEFVSATNNVESTDALLLVFKRLDSSDGLSNASERSDKHEALLRVAEAQASVAELTNRIDVLGRLVKKMARLYLSNKK